VLLVASHIKPWRFSDSKTERIKPSNELLLNALHGKAFDKGYISIEPTYRIMISTKIPEYEPSAVCKDWFPFFKRRQITLSDRFVPEERFLQYLNDIVFIKSLKEAYHNRALRQ
jgi:putative restriction endonuclease